MGHAGGDMINDLSGGGGVVRRSLSCAAIPLETSHEATVSSEVHLWDKRTQTGRTYESDLASSEFFNQQIKVKCLLTAISYVKSVKTQWIPIQLLFSKGDFHGKNVKINMQIILINLFLPPSPVQRQSLHRLGCLLCWWVWSVCPLGLPPHKILLFYESPG